MRSSSHAVGGALAGDGWELLDAPPAWLDVDAYRELLADPAQAQELGRRARERVLDEHTYVHRARQLLHLLGLGVPVVAGA